MTRIRSTYLGLVAVLLSPMAANAGLIVLDFDTPGTGSTIIGSPLVTALGTITASAAELTTIPDPEFILAGASGNNIDHLGCPGSCPAILSFDFDVISISLIFGGNGGDITIEARNGLGIIVDSFFQASTFGGQFAGPVSLNGSGIRSLQWFETGGNFAALDNIQITTASVPEPGTLALLGLGLAGIGLTRRRRKV